MARTKAYVCSICGDPSWPDGDHNAWPFPGRCCGICNTTTVIPARLHGILPDLAKAALDRADKE